MYFHFHCDDQGYDLLAALFKRTAIEEMNHVERCAERILFLGGDANLTPAEPVQSITDTRSMLERAAEMERESAKEYNGWANDCRAAADSATARVFEDLVADEERHFDQYMTEMETMDRFGERYLVLQSIERSKAISARSAEA
jgi:bacterioferritin